MDILCVLLLEIAPPHPSNPKRNWNTIRNIKACKKKIAAFLVKGVIWKQCNLKWP